MPPRPPPRPRQQVEWRCSPELVCEPVLITRGESSTRDACLIESSINSCRVSLRLPTVPWTTCRGVPQRLAGAGRRGDESLETRLCHARCCCVQGDPLEAELLSSYMRFIMQRAETLQCLRKVPVKVRAGTSSLGTAARTRTWVSVGHEVLCAPCPCAGLPHHVPHHRHAPGDAGQGGHHPPHREPHPAERERGHQPQAFRQRAGPGRRHAVPALPGLLTSGHFRALPAWCISRIAAGGGCSLWTRLVLIPFANACSSRRARQSASTASTSCPSWPRPAHAGGTVAWRRISWSQSSGSHASQGQGGRRAAKSAPSSSSSPLRPSWPCTSATQNVSISGVRWSRLYQARTPQQQRTTRARSHLPGPLDDMRRTVLPHVGQRCLQAAPPPSRLSGCGDRP